jgi:putative CocE/NonD family hydrolase
MDLIAWEQVYQHLPLATMDESVGQHIPVWRREMQHTQLDEYWKPLCYQEKFEQVDVSVLHISGWYDDEQIGTPINYIGMTTRGATAEARANQRLLMGPWGHATNAGARLGAVDFGPQAIIDLLAEETRWYDHYLKGKPVQVGVPVRLFVMGSNTWRDEQEWPLARTQWTSYYLHSQGHANSLSGDGILSPQPPSQESIDTYHYDPLHAVPFITDAISSQIGGPDDYSSLQRRDDILVYTSEPLADDVEVTGPIKVDLYAASSATDTDFMAMLIDVWPDGFRQRLCDGMVRARFRLGMQQPALIEAGRIYHYMIDCWNISQVFKTGHRICLQVTSSAFPKYDRNQNTGASLGMTTETVVAEQSIYHAIDYPSAVLLPIIPAHK